MTSRAFVGFSHLVAGLAMLCVIAAAQISGIGSGEVTGTLTLQIGKETRTVELKQLNVQAMRQARNTTGKVLMVWENRQWKVDMEKWRTDAGTKTVPQKRR